MHTKRLSLFLLLIGSSLLFMGLLLTTLRPTAYALEKTAVGPAVSPALDLQRIGEETGFLATHTATNGCQWWAETAVYLCPEPSPTTLTPPSPAARARVLARLQQGQAILLIPDSTADRVMAFDPDTGNLLDADFIPADPAHMSTPIDAILSATGQTILIADQVNDVVLEYDLQGNFVRIFAPAGGPNLDIMENIRGIALRPNGNLLVTVGSGANLDAIAEFDTAGTYIGNFIAVGAGGMSSPFDVYGRTADWLVAAINSDAAHRYDLTGTYLENFAAINTFPEQINEGLTGNVLIANFSGTQEGILEYAADGTFLGLYDVATIGGYRGAYELPNGNLLVTNANGVYEINRSNVLLDTKISSVSARFITLVQLAAEMALSVTLSTDTACGTAVSLELPPGSTDVTYCYTAVNTGNLPFYTHTVTDSQYGLLLSTTYTLTPGSSVYFTHTVPVSQSVQAVTTWQASGIGYTATTTATSAIRLADLTITKTVGTDPDLCASSPAITVTVGTAVYYCLTLANTGNVTLTHHTLQDPSLGISVTFPYTLTPGQILPVTNQVLTAVLGLPPAFGPVQLTETTTNTLTFSSSSASGLLTLDRQATAVTWVAYYYLYLPVAIRP